MTTTTTCLNETDKKAHLLTDNEIDDLEYKLVYGCKTSNERDVAYSLYLKIKKLNVLAKEVNL